MSNASGDDQKLKDQQRLSNVVYVLLGTRDPEKVRNWINAAFREEDALRAELGRIREAALTPEEAQALLDDVPTDDPRYQHWCSAILKLRLVSGGALKEGATQ